jgi:hypothetical protein
MIGNRERDCTYLVFHQRNERRNDDARFARHERRQLVAKRLARSRRL